MLALEERHVTSPWTPMKIKMGVKFVSVKASSPKLGAHVFLIWGGE